MQYRRDLLRLYPGLSGRPPEASHRLRKFWDLYFNPFQSVADICQASAVSRATFYRHARDLQVPTLRVALHDNSGLPRHSSSNNDGENLGDFIERLYELGAELSCGFTSEG